MNEIIKVSSLSKSFDSIQAVKDINLSVKAGSLFAFLGTNGAGKSTTIHILCTLLKPDGGSVTIDGYTLGKNDDEIRKSIGIVFQDSLLDARLTVYENLLVRGSFYGLQSSQLREAIERVCKTVHIDEFINQPYGKLSGGQRRRVDIARALIHTPKILFLDEPTTGLDPQTRNTVWDTIRQLQQDHQMTVFLTTHYMEEAAQAEYITIMGHGEILAEGTPIELKQKYASDLLKIKPINKHKLANKLMELNVAFKDDGEVFCISLNSTMAAIDLSQKIKGFISNIEIINGTMDDVFLNIAGSEVEKR